MNSEQLNLNMRTMYAVEFKDGKYYAKQVKCFASKKDAEAAASASNACSFLGKAIGKALEDVGKMVQEAFNPIAKKLVENAKKMQPKGVSDLGPEHSKAVENNIYQSLINIMGAARNSAIVWNYTDFTNVLHPRYCLVDIRLHLQPLLNKLEKEGQIFAVTGKQNRKTTELVGYKYLQ
jgi:hypothetical protein